MCKLPFDFLHVIVVDLENYKGQKHLTWSYAANYLYSKFLNSNI